MSNDKHGIKQKPDKSEGGTLTTLWRNILKDNNMLNKDTIEYLASRYVKNSKILKSSVRNINRKTKGSILNNMTASSMTWSVFLDLLFNVLNVVKITVSIKLTHANGSETISSIVVNDSNKKIKSTESDK